MFAEFGVPKQRLYGIELSEEAVAATRRQGFQVELRRLEEAEYPPGSFVLVVLHQVIEHVSDPRATLSQLHRLLAPGGAVVPHHGLIRNEPDLNRARIWIVQDKGEENGNLLSAAPDRVAYLFDEVSGRILLRAPS